MRMDQFGYETSLGSPEAALAWDRVVLGFLAHAAATPDHLAEVLTAEPGFAMGHAARGLFCMMLGRREMVETARAAHEAALVCAQQGAPAPREMGYVRALGAWLGGRPSGTVHEMEAILTRWPEDALAMKISHATRFILGDIEGMRASVEALLPAWDARNPARGYLLGCHAFALEETGEYGRAEATGRLGLGLSPDDAWGLHAVAHVFDMTCDSRAGLNWLAGREAAWAHCNNFRYHVWWHKALMHLDQGEIDAVLHLYDTEVRRDRTDDFRDISNGAAMLVRLELEGIDVGDRWEEMADISERRIGDACLIFADLHYLLALVGGGRKTAVRRLMARLRREAECAGGAASEMMTRTADPGLSAATGLEAFGAGNYKAAFVNLRRARHSMQLVGGSHAQRDVFERLTIDSALRAGFMDEAESILKERSARRAGRLDRYAATRIDLIAGLRGDGSGPGQIPAE